MLHYYKCNDCLSPMTTETTIDRSAAKCFCGGTLSYMGHVKRGRVVVTVEECPCNTLCTDATGPNCSCSCGGANHGVHMRADIKRDIDKDTAILTPPNKEKAIQCAQEYRIALDAARERFHAIYGTDIKNVRDGVWLSRDRWEAVHYGSCDINHAASLKTHKGRIRALNALFVRQAVVA